MLFHFYYFFFYSSGAHRDLHSFPTRRSSDLYDQQIPATVLRLGNPSQEDELAKIGVQLAGGALMKDARVVVKGDRKSTRLNSSHRCISYAVFCLKKKNKKNNSMNTHRQSVRV